MLRCETCECGGVPNELNGCGRNSTLFIRFKRQLTRETSDGPIVVEEADRLQMNSLEQMRSIFDDGYLGMILIGMPGIEKRITRFPQLYSRIGFVHEFRPLGDVEMQELLERRWAPAGVKFSEGALTPEVIARLIRITSGNLRLLTKLLTQIERVLSVNETPQVSVQIVEAARDSLVIGQA